MLNYELKFSTQTKFGTIILNLNLHVQYQILWRDYDVIFEKSVKQ